MSNSCKITIPITPKAKASVRMGLHGSYNPSARGMEDLRKYVKSQLPDATFPLFRGPLLVIVHFRVPVPRSVPPRRRNPQHMRPHTKRPDGDNLEKFLNDALNGVLWFDDSRIVWLLRSKTNTAAKVGETTIFVRELSDTPPDYAQILEDIKQNIQIGADHVA